MLLKEIEMDWPYHINKEFVQQLQEEHELGYEEAVRKDYEINWKGKRREFQLMTRCMTAMVERIMLPVKTKDCWKILVECVNICTDKSYKNLLGVYTIQVEFDFETFFDSADSEKRSIIIDTINEAINRISAQITFDVSNISEACKKVRNCGYSNEWLWKKTIKLQGKTIGIQIKHDIQAVEIYMLFMDKSKNVLGKSSLVKTIPDERVYSRYLGRLEVISEKEVALITKDEERIIGVCN